jgi:flagellar biosynthetic protein FliR
MAPTSLADLLNPTATAALLLWTRITAALLVAPGWNHPFLGPRIRFLCSLLLTFLLFPLLHAYLDPEPEVPSFLAQLIHEAAAGLTLGCSVALIIQAARASGELMALHAGLAPASLLDPETAAGSDSTPLGQLHALIATLVFLSLDGPLRIIQSLARSYLKHDEHPPPASDPIVPPILSTLLDSITHCLGLAIQAAAPVALALLITSFALALLARVAPNMQTLALNHTVRMLMGVILTALFLGSAATLYTRLLAFP